MIVNREGVAVDCNLAGEPTVHAVVTKKMRIGFDASEIVDCNGDQIIAPVFYECAQNQPSDTPEAVDRNAHGHRHAPSRGFVT